MSKSNDGISLGPSFSLFFPFFLGVFDGHKGWYGHDLVLGERW